MTANLVAYDPNDITQQSFLAALALGETGGGTGSSWVGYGGADLSHASTDQYGFPQWGGVGNTHAAGTYQFQPSTWDDIASRYGLNFSNPNDQSAGAWYLAEETYSNRTGRSLQQDLASGNMSQVQSALAGIWPSVTGNQAAPGGLVQSIMNGLGMGGGASGGSSGSTTASSGNPLWDGVVNIFQRFGVLIIGGFILVIALWVMLSDAGVVPSPKDTMKAAAALASRNSAAA